MSYRLVGTLRALTVEPTSPTLELILSLLGEGYTVPEICHVIDVSISSVGKWTNSNLRARTVPSSKTDEQSNWLLQRLNEHFAQRRDKFPLPPVDLKALLRY